MARKKKGDAHHGGAWKVAYADFVTAMMALFMVLWISAQDEQILISTASYFQSPFDSPLKGKAGLLQFDSTKPANGQSGEGANPNENQQIDTSMIDLEFLQSMAKDFYRMLNLDENLADRPIDVQVTSDGLRVQLFDRSSKPFFKGNSAEFTEWGDFVMQSIAWMIDRNDFKVVVEGHTKAGLDLPEQNYTAWELSADRANSARRALTHYAVAPELIERVTGFADTRPLPFTAPDADSNQRIALSLRVGGRDKPTLVADR